MNSASTSNCPIVIYPESTAVGLKRNWNDGRTPTQPGRDAIAEVDDVKYVLAVLDDIQNAPPVNAKRIYATGISNGAFMAQRLATESDRFAAIGPVIGGMAETIAEDFDPPAHVSVMMINGVDDPLVPYESGMVRFGRQELRRTVSVEAAAQSWVDHNSGNPNPEVTELPDLDPDDGTGIIRMKYTGGTDDTEVQILKINGGGHNWPNTRQYAPEILIGRTSGDIDATGELPEFFLRHPRR